MRSTFFEPEGVATISSATEETTFSEDEGGIARAGSRQPLGEVENPQKDPKNNGGRGKRMSVFGKGIIVCANSPTGGKARKGNEGFLLSRGCNHFHLGEGKRCLREMGVHQKGKERETRTAD